MKIFKIETHIDGDTYTSNTLLSIGKNIKFNMEPWGWYIRLESPFTKTVNYVDAHDFIKKEGPCRKVFLIRRVPGIKKLIKVNAWMPISNT
jgi:hypothetical protein